SSNKELIAPRKNPKGSACLALMLRYNLFMWNNHTTQALPCLNTKHTAAKSIIKGQHALRSYKNAS
ncbi:hypothetical protein, partial [uncultured Pseudoalteromonas sp.]|uniref:hypothetical protein n=1 Tax=uncultured Pseudoalteromonas sp. TaxID=114053 RepID=UPI00260A68E1